MLSCQPSEHWLHPPSLKEAAILQREWAAKVILTDDFLPLNYIAGVDVSNQWHDPKQMLYAAVVVLEIKTWRVVSTASIAMRQIFPYVPGFLGFREAPALVAAIQQLTVMPQLIMVDGHGISHPRGLGIASHLGVLLDCPTVGVAKSILVGQPEHEVGQMPGEQSSLVWQGRQIGRVLRTKKAVKPLYISSGHRVSLMTAVQLVSQCITHYRLPEPTRQAHLAANNYRRDYQETGTDHDTCI